MPTVNDSLHNIAISQLVDFIRFGNGVVRRMIAVLNRSDARLSQQLSDALERMPADSYTVERLSQLLISVRQTNATAYQQVMAALQPELRSAVTAISAGQVSMLATALPAVVQARFPVAAVNVDQVYAAALSRPFQGRLLKDWASNLEQSRLAAIENAVRQGYVEGRTTDQIIRDIRGTRASGYSDGILNRGRAELESVVRTALSHIAQTTRQASDAANADIIKAVQWHATLDTRTTVICQVHDGLQYTADTHKPIGHSVPWMGGPGRAHFGCRSVSVPVTKSWRELGIPAADMTPDTRSSMDGQVPGDTTYGSWFAKQSAERQDEILGPVRAKLFREGKATYSQFFNDKGVFLTLDQLMAKIS